MNMNCGVNINPSDRNINNGDRKSFKELAILMKLLINKLKMLISKCGVITASLYFLSFQGSLMNKASFSLWDII